MALKAETKTKLKAMGLDVDKLIAAVTADGETDYEVPEVQVFTQEQLDTRDANKLAEGKKAGEAEGEKKGKELAAKNLKKKFGIENEETKDLDKVVDLVNAKVATGDTGLREQNAALLKDKETLQAQLLAKDGDIDGLKFDNELLGYFPPNRGTGLADDERLTIIKGKFQFETVDGKRVAKRDGDVVKDKTTHAALPIKQVVSDYFTERQWVSQGGTGGRGGGDNTPQGGSAGLKTRSAVEAQWVKDNPGKNPVSPEFQSHLESVAKDVADFDYYN